MPAAIVGAGISAAGSVAGGVASGKGAKKAAKIQAQAAAEQHAFLTNQYNQNAERFGTDINAGDAATARLRTLLGLGGGDGSDPTATLRATPGYAFAMSEALRGVNSNAYARGLGNSGATQKALLATSQGLADQNFGNYFSQVSSVADRGAQSKSALAGVSNVYANNYTQVAQNAADNASNYQMFKAANFNNTLSGILRAGGQAFGSSFGGGSTSAPASTQPGFGAILPSSRWGG